MVEVRDCEACRRLQEIDYDKRLVGCGETITKTLLDFGVKPSVAIEEAQPSKLLYHPEVPCTPVSLLCGETDTIAGGDHQVFSTECQHSHADVAHSDMWSGPPS